MTAGLSYAPHAPAVFINDFQLKALWESPQRYYLFAAQTEVPRLEKLIGSKGLHSISQNGGKVLFSNYLFD